MSQKKRPAASVRKIREAMKNCGESVAETRLHVKVFAYHGRVIPWR